MYININKKVIAATLCLGCSMGLVGCKDRAVVKQPIAIVSEYTEGMSEVDFANYYANLMLSGEYEKVWELTQVPENVLINKEMFLSKCESLGPGKVEPYRHEGTIIKVKTSEGKQEITAEDIMQVYDVYKSEDGLYAVDYGVNNDNTVDGTLKIGITRDNAGVLKYTVPSSYYNTVSLSIKVPKNVAIRINNVDVPINMMDLENVYHISNYVKQDIDIVTLVTDLGEKNFELSAGVPDLGDEALTMTEEEISVAQSVYEFDWELTKIEYDEIEDWLKKNTQNVFDAILTGDGLENNFGGTLSSKANKEEIKPAYLRIVDSFKDMGSYKATDLKCVDIRLLTNEELSGAEGTNTMLNNTTLEVQVKVHYSYIKEGLGVRNIYDEEYDTSVYLTKDEDGKYKFMGFGEKFFTNIF